MCVGKSGRENEKQREERREELIRFRIICQGEREREKDGVESDKYIQIGTKTDLFTESKQNRQTNISRHTTSMEA